MVSLWLTSAPHKLENLFVSPQDTNLRDTRRIVSLYNSLHFGRTSHATVDFIWCNTCLKVQYKINHRVTVTRTSLILGDTEWVKYNAVTHHHKFILSLHRAWHCKRQDKDDRDEDEENQYGIHRSRQDTSIANCDSSSLSPAQIMEQEVYYASAEEAISRSLHLAQLLCLLLISYHHYSTMIDNWQRVGNVMADAITSVRDKVHHLRIATDRLLFLMSWVRAYGEMSLLYAEDLLIDIRRQIRFQPKRS